MTRGAWEYMHPNEHERGVEEVIEILALSITHSEQGHYALNERFVRDIIDQLITKVLEEERSEQVRLLEWANLLYSYKTEAEARRLVQIKIDELSALSKEA